MKEKTPYDYFLLNLRMTEMMVEKLKGQTTNDDALHAQVGLLTNLIDSLVKLKEDLSALLTDKQPN